MRKKTKLCVAALLSTLSLSLAAHTTHPLPPGNYLQTCKDCYVKHHKLHCKCQDKNGQYRYTEAYISRECLEVQNLDAHLTCTQYPSSHQTMDVNAGPIFNNDQAQGICPNVCAQQSARWNGQWRTVNAGSSVCGCQF